MFEKCCMSSFDVRQNGVRPITMSDDVDYIEDTKGISVCSDKANFVHSLKINHGK